MRIVFVAQRYSMLNAALNRGWRLPLQKTGVGWGYPPKKAALHNMPRPFLTRAARPKFGILPATNSRWSPLY